jgi:23S rRNA (guanosine2251-2'-O)-methyltransferase
MKHKKAKHTGKTKPSGGREGPGKRPNPKAFRRKKPHVASPEPLRPSTQGVLLWGIHAVMEAWRNPSRQCFRLWLTEAGKASLADGIATDIRSRPQPVLVERHDLDKLLPPHSVHQGVVLEAAPLPEPQLHEVLKTAEASGLIIVLDQVTDPHNVGAILRSAAAFGAGAVIMTERNAPPTTGVLAKSASGAVEHVPLIRVTNLSRALNELQEAGFWCVGLAEEAERDLSALDLSARTAVVLGAEGEGLRRLTRENCDELARLPTGGRIGSLNVSNAAAIALYEARRQKMKFR